MSRRARRRALSDPGHCDPRGGCVRSRHRLEIARCAPTGGGILRLAIVGYGYWGSKHVRVLTAIPDVDVTVVDNDPSRLASAALAFPTVRLAPTLEEVLPSTDAVLIATPPRTHARLALMTVRAGRHVFVEKPLATERLGVRGARRRRGSRGRLADGRPHVRVQHRGLEVARHRPERRARADLATSTPLGSISVCTSSMSTSSGISHRTTSPSSTSFSADRRTGSRRGATATQAVAPRMSPISNFATLDANVTRVHPRELARPVQGAARHRRRQREDGRLQRPVLERAHPHLRLRC